jgi:uncharacterized phage protein (TIGR01671 family)
MRELEFRAICVDTNKFVYGFYVVNGGDYHTIAYQSPDNADALRVHEVDVKTLGQFTGLLDKNGVKIFEEDVVKTSSGVTGEMVYDDCLGFIINGVQIYELGSDQSMKLFEVVGNIHEVQNV